MTKKWMMIAAGALVAIGALWFAKYYFLDQSTVTFDVISSINKVEIYTKDNVKVRTLIGGNSMRLVHGDYYAIPVNDDYSNAHIAFTSPSKSAIRIDPDYSIDKLASLAAQALPSVKALFAKEYPSLMPSYSIESFTLYKKGQWGGGLLARNDSTLNDTKDVYRFAVHYDDGWQSTGDPDLILTQASHSDIPADVLYAIDTLTYEPSL